MNDVLRLHGSGLRAQASSIALFLAICLAIGLGAGLVMLLRPDVAAFGPPTGAPGIDAGL